MTSTKKINPNTSALKAGMQSTKNTGQDFESYVQYVYSTLLNLRGEKTQVSRRTTFQLATGDSYEVDVYYEFSKVGVRHRVAIECKDWKRPVDQGKILEFHQKIKNIGHDVVGVVVSRSGYQAGVEKVAARHNISLLTGDDLPSLPHLVGIQIKSLALHEPDLIGEPFWVIAETGDTTENLSTGSYYAPRIEGKPTIPFFISKKHAETYLKHVADRESWAVFGMPQYKLKALLRLAKLGGVKFAIVQGPPELNGCISLRDTSLEELETDFII
ncbi:restriction endonuclease [Pseudomonas siliginis]|uniref:restriction endonuclease n=1 Tax=Pseudomonas siliginis TaxID=2842346 RepID=UPI002118C664|nr:restriction endonuclease [Pseudomonas siliginis]